MAVSNAPETPGTPEASKPAVATSAQSRPAPGWVLGLYLGGLALVYGGERVLSGLEKGAGAVTVLGLLLALAATGLRFAPRFRVGGERKSIETLLAILSVTGLVGLAVYFLTSGPGAEKLGLDTMPVDERESIVEIARVVWASLIVLSTVPMVFVETALRPMRNAERPESRRVRAAAGAGVSLALAAVYGSLFVYAASGVDLEVDYSYFRTSRPSESTRKLARALTEPVRVVAFFPDVNEVRSEVETYLRDLASGAPNLKVEIHDRLLVPKLAKELRAVQDGMVVLSRDSTVQTLSIGTDIEQARPKLKTLDRDFQEQMLKLARSKRTAYLTVGHGEINDSGRPRSGEAARSAQIVRTLLQKQNFTIRELGLSQGLAHDVPEDADVVLVLGPTEPLSREEIATLTRYAERGGRLVLALDPDGISTRQLLTQAEGTSATVPAAGTPPTTPAASAAPVEPPAANEGNAVAAPQPAGARPGAAHAPALGVNLEPTVLANERQHVRVRYNDSDRTRLVTNSFSSHASVSTLSRNSPRAAIVFFGAASLERIAGAPASNTKVDFTVRSLAGTFRDANRNYTQDTEERGSGIFNLAAAISRPLGPNGTAAERAEKDDQASKKKDDKKDAKKDDVREMRAFVVADADAFTDFVMGEVLGNQILFVDALRWLVGEQSVQGLPNTEEDVRIEHTKQEDLGWFYASIFGAPGLVLAAGLFVSQRSRRKGGKR